MSPVETIFTCLLVFASGMAKRFTKGFLRYAKSKAVDPTLSVLSLSTL